MTFTFRNNGLVESLQSLTLERYDFIRHAFCTRHKGTSNGAFLSLNVSAHVGDRQEDVLKNLTIIADAFKIDPLQFILVDQVHGDKILILDDPLDNSKKYEFGSFDAVVTNQPGLALGITTADCCPIFLVDTIRQVVGAVHAGWQGTALKIAAKAADTLFKRFASRPENTLAVIGPAIGPCCYEVDRQVYEAMDHDKNRDFLFQPCPKAGKWMFDLPRANKLHILEMGVPEENIFTARTCTVCRKDIFFSHRGERGKTGRQLNFIMLEKQL